MREVDSAGAETTLQYSFTIIRLNSDGIQKITCHIPDPPCSI